MFLDLWVVVKTAWVVVKVAEWWLGLTTSDQHGQNLYIIDIHCWGIRATLTDGRHSQSSVVIGHNELFILKIQCTTYYVSSHTHTHTHTHTICRYPLYVQGLYSPTIFGQAVLPWRSISTQLTGTFRHLTYVHYCIARQHVSHTSTFLCLPMVGIIAPDERSLRKQPPFQTSQSSRACAVCFCNPHICWSWSYPGIVFVLNYIAPCAGIAVE